MLLAFSSRVLCVACRNDLPTWVHVAMWQKPAFNVHLQEKECVAQPRVVGEPRRVDWVRRFGVIGVRNVLLMQWIEELRNAVGKRDQDYCL